MKRPFALFLLLGVAACSSLRNAVWSLAPGEVVRDEAVAGALRPLGEVPRIDCTFRDSLLSVTWTCGPERLHATFTNHSDKDMVLLVDEARYTDLDGIETGLYTGDASYSEVPGSAAPLRLGPGQSVVTRFMPRSHATWSRTDGWIVRPLFPRINGFNLDDREFYSGRSVLFRLPVAVGAERTVYRFGFVLDGAQMPPRRRVGGR